MNIILLKALPVFLSWLRQLFTKLKEGLFSFFYFYFFVLCSTALIPKKVSALAEQLELGRSQSYPAQDDVADLIYFC